MTAAMYQTDVGVAPDIDPVRAAITTPRLRSDLIIAKTITAAGLRYTIKVPDTEKFFQLGEDEYRILCLMDGTRSLSQLLVAVDKECGLDVDARTLWTFVKLLNKACCLVVPAQVNPDTIKSRKHYKVKSVLYLDKHVFNPDRLLSYLEPRLRFFYTTGFLLFTALAFVVSLGLIYSSVEQLTLEIKSLGTVSGFVSLYVAAAVVTALHEFGHGLTCKHFGGKVPSMGLLLILLTFPCFYTDVSDAWLFEKKKQRIWVTSAGIIFESVIWSFATALWLLTAVDSMIHQLALGVMVSSGAGMVFSLNPLLKFDGYYLISDYLEIPNLRSKSMAYFSIWLGALFTGRFEGLPAASVRERRIFVLYGFAVLVFTLFILGGVILLLSSTAINAFGPVFLLPAVYIFWLLLGSTIKGVWAGMNLASEQQKERDKRPDEAVGETHATANIVPKLDNGNTAGAKADLKQLINTGDGNSNSPIQTGGAPNAPAGPPKRHTGKLFLLLFAALIIASYFLETDLEIAGQAQLKPVAAQSIEPSIHGLIREVYVQEGSVVREGDTLLRIDDEGLQSELKSSEASLLSARKELILLENGTRPEVIATKRAELAILHADVVYHKDAYQRLGLLPDSVTKIRLLEAKHAWESSMKRVSVVNSELALLEAGTAIEEIEAKRANILSLEVLRERLLQDIANTTLLSPISGVVVTKEPERLIGKYTARGSAVLDIEHVGEFKAKVLVKERDVAEIKVGQPVRLKVYGYPSKEFYGEVRHISSTVEIETIGSLTTPAITVEASIDDPEHVLKTGMNGIARIKSERKTYFDLALRKLVHWFKIEFWL